MIDFFKEIFDFLFDSFANVREKGKKFSRATTTTNLGLPTTPTQLVKHQFISRKQCTNLKCQNGYWSVVKQLPRARSIAKNRVVKLALFGLIGLIWLGLIWLGLLA